MTAEDTTIVVPVYDETSEIMQQDTAVIQQGVLSVTSQKNLCGQKEDSVKNKGALNGEAKKKLDG